MKLDIKKAFLSPFTGEGWFGKVTLFGILNIICFAFNEFFKTNYDKYLLLVFIICMPLGVMLSGYSLQYIHNEIYDIYPILPQWKQNIKSYLKKGIEYFGIVLSYCFIFLLLITPFGLILDKISGAYSNFIIMPIVFLIILSVMIIIQLETCSYSQRFEFKDCYEWQSFYGLISKVKKEIVISLFLFFLISALSGIFGLIMEKTNSIIFMVLEIIIMPYILAATLLIPYNLSAQTYKIAKYRLDEN